MTQKEKQLLLRDLCARLPYGVNCKMVDDEGEEIVDALTGTIIEAFDKGIITDIKPYLRPMSSMTEEEENEWRGFNIDPLLESVGKPHTRIEDLMLIAKSQYDPLDWLNAHHFDYRGLIPMGLALEAPEGMYSKEESEKGSEIPIPKTVDEAVKTLAKIVSKEDRDYLLENGAISMHDSMGRWIRNEWGLWTDSELKNELKKKGFEHPDDMSNYIIEEFIKYCLEKI